MSPGNGRLARLGAGVAGVALSAGLLSACGSSAAGPGAQACRDVTAAQHYMKAASATSGPAATSYKRRALHELDLAEPLAAEAAGTNGSWQALQANLQEVNGPPSQVIVRAVVADCSAIGG